MEQELRVTATDQVSESSNIKYLFEPSTFGRDFVWQKIEKEVLIVAVISILLDKVIWIRTGKYLFQKHADYEEK